MPVDRSEHHPHSATLTPAELEHIHQAISLMITNPQMGGEHRLNNLRTLISPELRYAVGTSKPDMAATVAQAALELKPGEQMEWLQQALTNHTLDWMAGFGNVRSIAELALAISISDLPKTERIAMLGRLLNPRGPTCAAVAESLDASAIAATAYAMVNCLPECPQKWLETVQNVLLTDTCVQAVIESVNHGFVGTTALAAAMLPNKDRRTQVLQRLLTKSNCLMLEHHASTHPNALAFAVFAAQHLPADECVPALQDLMSTAAVSAVLRTKDGYFIASLARGAWHLPTGQREEALSQLVTTETCQLVRYLNNAHVTELMREAIQMLSAGPQRQAVLQALGPVLQWQGVMNSPTPSGERTSLPGGPSP